jgi:hypothetical protein
MLAHVRRSSKNKMAGPFNPIDAVAGFSTQSRSSGRRSQNSRCAQVMKYWSRSCSAIDHPFHFNVGAGLELKIAKFGVAGVVTS